MRIGVFWEDILEHSLEGLQRYVSLTKSLQAGGSLPLH